MEDCNPGAEPLIRFAPYGEIHVFRYVIRETAESTVMVRHGIPPRSLSRPTSEIGTYPRTFRRSRLPTQRFRGLS